MQNIAFAYVLIPLLKTRQWNEKKKAAFLIRHVERFSTHPYMSAAIAASVAKLEERYLSDDGACPEAVRLKRALMAPYAAIGDPFFWGTLRPLVAVSSLAGFLLFYSPGKEAICMLWFLPPLLFFTFYNSFHLWIRMKGFIEGYRDGKGAVNFFVGMNLPEKAKKLRLVTLIILSYCAYKVLSVLELAAGETQALFLPLLFCGIILVCYGFIKKGMPVSMILYGALILSVSYSYMR